MNILVTGSSGFVGRNLVENLKNIRDGKDRTRPGIKIDAIYEYDVQNTREELDMFCASADFVFNLAGVDRPRTRRNLWREILALHRSFLTHSGAMEIRLR